MFAQTIKQHSSNTNNAQAQLNISEANRIERTQQISFVSSACVRDATVFDIVDIALFSSRIRPVLMYRAATPGRLLVVVGLVVAAQSSLNNLCHELYTESVNVDI